MTIKIAANCDSCSVGLEEDEEVYCEPCFSELKKEIDNLEEKVGQLEDEITGLEADITTLEEGLK